VGGLPNIRQHGLHEPVHGTGLPSKAGVVSIGQEEEHHGHHSARLRSEAGQRRECHCTQSAFVANSRLPGADAIQGMGSGATDLKLRRDKTRLRGDKEGTVHLPSKCRGHNNLSKLASYYDEDQSVDWPTVEYKTEELWPEFSRNHR
jgi:hypothetical protein